MNAVTPADADGAVRLAAIERENAKLRKINRVLMDRVERSMDQQGDAFSLFQTAIVLENRIQERTAALGRALQALEAANHAVEAARREEAQARRFLGEAIESISEGFLLCDAEGRIVLLNSKYRDMWPGLARRLEPGEPFAALVREAAASGAVADAAEDREAWIRRRLASHTGTGEPFTIRRADGRWLQVSDRRTRDGAVVSLYTDITEIKLAEDRRRERELAEKSVLLQTTLDNLAQGVSVFDAGLRLAAWNQRFVELLAVPSDLVRLGAPLEELLSLDAMRAQFPDDGRDAPASLVIEREAPHGRILEIRRNPMPGGGFVSTYTDITERNRSAEALRDSERRIRLITDAVPALISYVDASGRFRFTNKGYQDWFGRPLSEINGGRMRDVLGGVLYDMRAQYVERALRGEECRFEMALPSGPGGVSYAQAHYVPHFAADGQVLGFFALIQDITEQRLAAEELREAKEGLERRVEERTRELRLANVELNAAKSEAEQANLSKTRFLAAASHDLLQPLSAARVFASALAERRLAPPNRQLVGSTLAALDSVEGILTALLDISKLDAGVQPVTLDDFRLADLFEALAEEYRIVANRKSLDLRFVASSLPARSDPMLLGRILRNYLSNAVRYTEPGGRILVGCRRRGDSVLVGVWDTGAGVPADKLEEIFEEFRRLDTKATQAERGMGLGLAIVRRIGRALGHPLVVRSSFGRGSLFGVEVPRAPAPPAPAERPAAAASPVPSLAGTRVVVIDNDAAILAGMRTLLEHWGCETVAGASGAAAMAALLAWGGSPDLVLADYHLDEGEVGLDAVAAIRGRFGAALPAVIMTADHTDALQARVREAGCQLLHKPIRNARLRSLLAHLLRDRAGAAAPDALSTG